MFHTIHEYSTWSTIGGTALGTGLIQAPAELSFDDLCFSHPSINDNGENIGAKELQQIVVHISPISTLLYRSSYSTTEQQIEPNWIM